MKNKIPKFLQEKLNLKGAAKPEKFPNEIKDFMVEYSEYYNWKLDSNLTKIFNVMKQGITEIPKCEYQGCDAPQRFNYLLKLTRGCCKDHNSKITSLEKYGEVHHMHLEDHKRFGLDNIFGTEEFKNNAKDLYLSKWGVDNPSKVPKIQEKQKKTNLEKYGVEWNIASESSIKKQKETNLKKYGVEYYVQSLKFKECLTLKYRRNFSNHKKIKKIKKNIIRNYKLTCLEKYGVDNYAKSEEFKARKDEINLKQKQKSQEKFGTNHPMQSEICKEKYRTTALKNHGIEYPGVLSKFKTKEYVWKTGEVSKVQGFEPIVLNELEEKGYTFNEIKTGFKEVPKIAYNFEGKNHTYYPDFFIPKENLIIEVKSNYTLNKELDKNNAKFEAVKNLGFNFRLEVR